MVELSQYIVNGVEIESTILSPKMKFFNHTPCKVASKQDTNSVSIVEVAVRICFVLLQDISPLANIKMYHDVDFCELTQLAKSELE